MKHLAMLLIAFLLGGCALTPPAPVQAPGHLFADHTFAAPTELADISQVFALSPAMRAYLRSSRFRELSRQHGDQRGLIEALYRDGELKLDYDATETRTAAQTFAHKSGNCLSLVIMTAAFARELGQDVTFQEVRVDETWSRLGSLYVSNNHVNILLGRRASSRFDAEEYREQFVVDFLPQVEAAKHRAVPLTEAAVLAMYANNRAAEALSAGQVTDAYWWVRKALETDPASSIPYNTLGVVYMRHGNYTMAERAFRTVLEQQPDHRLTMQNLVPVLEALGKSDEAKAMRERLARLDPEPPFHYFNLGRAAMERRDFRRARDLFAREVARAPYYHEFHFWYAVASMQLGDTDGARQQLALAQQTSTTPAARARYAAKLEHLRATVPARRR